MPCHAIHYSRLSQQELDEDFAELDLENSVELQSVVGDLFRDVEDDLLNDKEFGDNGEFNDDKLNDCQYVYVNPYNLKLILI